MGFIPINASQESKSARNRSLSASSPNDSSSQTSSTRSIPNSQLSNFGQVTDNQLVIESSGSDGDSSGSGDTSSSSSHNIGIGTATSQRQIRQLEEVCLLIIDFFPAY